MNTIIFGECDNCCNTAVLRITREDQRLCDQCFKTIKNRKRGGFLDKWWR